MRAILFLYSTRIFVIKLFYMPTVHCKVFDAPTVWWYASANLNWRWTLEPDQKLG